MEDESPKLRTVNKVKPPYAINDFPRDFGQIIGGELVYLLATKGRPDLEGPEWEAIFAKSIGAEWKPSNIGLDDVVLESCAWGAKTVKAKAPSKQKSVRLISGRNSPYYSFDVENVKEIPPNEVGNKVLSIWNERVADIRKRHKHLRTVVMVKSHDLSEVFIFEFETVRYDSEIYAWKWNKSKNLEGLEKGSNRHKFTWQPSGAQFTIIEDVPEDGLIIRIKKPKKLDKQKVLKDIGFDKSWVTVIKKR
ncbi:MAG: hypothetical protein HY098_00230 [Nitrospinae bacterium]|nr:hypothetical protein [Nitrospinota bacterium]